MNIYGFGKKFKRFGFFLWEENLGFYIIGYRKNLYLPRKNLHYTLISLPVINRTMTIHRNRYHFDESIAQPMRD
jgi:hypothetical protein